MFLPITKTDTLPRQWFMTPIASTFRSRIWQFGVEQSGVRRPAFVSAKFLEIVASFSRSLRFSHGSCYTTPIESRIPDAVSLVVRNLSLLVVPGVLLFPAIGLRIFETGTVVEGTIFYLA